jgi:Na+-transporting NADH:ubiquinone oxidoreductase subunit NqrC
MKSISKILSAIVVLSLISITALAQPGRGDRGMQNRDRDMDRLRDVPVEVRTEAHLAVFDEYLNLTDTQKEQIREADAVFAKKSGALKEEKVNRRKKMGMAKELRNEHQRAIHDLLTKEQYSVFLDKRQAIRYDIRQRLRSYNQNGN